MFFIPPKLKKSIYNFFQHLISIGIRESDDSTEIKRIKLLNIFCWAWHLRTVVEFLDDDLGKTLYLSLFDFFLMVTIVTTVQILQYKRKFLAARLIFVCSIMCTTFFYTHYVYANENRAIQYYFILVPGGALMFIDSKKIIAALVIVSFSLMYIAVQKLNLGSLKESNGSFGIVFLYFGVFIMMNYFKNLNLKNEAALKVKTKELEDLDKFKSQFFTNMSHEIRTPITLIKGEIDNLNDAQVSRNKLTNIYKNTNKQIGVITNIVNTVIDLAKMQSSNFKLNTKPTNISDLIRKIHLSFESVFIKKKLELVLNTNNKDYITNIDAVFMERALNNILLNALKYTNEGFVSINITTKNNIINIIIKDTGIGIPQKNLNTIFNRFHQVDNDINQSGGSGIGLAFSKEIINLHKGEITVKSKEDKGSAFTISLPLIKEQSKDIQVIEDNTEKNTTNYNSQTTKNTTFLIVDDNTDMRDYLKKLLKNYNCTEAENGLVALDILKNNTVDFIITDYMMPKMNGLEFIKKLNELKIDIPTIMVTAKTDIDSKLEVLKLGVQDYISKPFDKQELLIRIDNLLGNQSNKENYKKENNIKLMVNSSSDLLKKIEQHINTNSSQEEFSQEFLSEKFHLSKSSLYRHIKSKTGLTPKEFITEIRLQKARKIVANNPDILLKQLALEVGFKHSSYFSKLYLNRFGHKPLKDNLSDF